MAGVFLGRTQRPLDAKRIGSAGELDDLCACPTALRRYSREPEIGQARLPVREQFDRRTVYAAKPSIRLAPHWSEAPSPVDEHRTPAYGGHITVPPLLAPVFGQPIHASPQSPCDRVAVARRSRVTLEDRAARNRASHFADDQQRPARESGRDFQGSDHRWRLGNVLHA